MGLRELHIVHAKYLTPLSYHVYSALGAAELRRAAGQQYASSVDEAERLLSPMVPSTQQALSISQSAVSPVIWQATLHATHLAREVRQIVAQSVSQGSSY